MTYIPLVPSFNEIVEAEQSFSWLLLSCSASLPSSSSATTMALFGFLRLLFFLFLLQVHAGKPIIDFAALLSHVFNV